MLREVPEDSLADDRPANPSSFYDPRTWTAFHRFMGSGNLLLTYRRDKRGRFRKVN
jgi:hypothetical protein